MSRHIGFIYIIEKEPHICKIGFSKYSPVSRLKELSLKNKCNMKLKGFLETDLGFKYEKHIHEILAEFLIGHEWFKLSYLDIKNKLKDHYEFTDGEPPLGKRKKDYFSHIILRIPEDMIKEIDSLVEKSLGITRTGWILQTLDKQVKIDTMLKSNPE